MPSPATQPADKARRYTLGMTNLVLRSSQMALEKFFDRDIEPEPLCRNCESFDGGGLTPEGVPVWDHGDCNNKASPFFQTSVGNTCRHFFPCSTRWPDADHG